MATDEALRQRILRLINDYGVSQKILAARMGMSEAMLSRWLRQQKGVRPITVVAMDGFERYVGELERTLSEAKQPSRKEQGGRDNPPPFQDKAWVETEDYQGPYTRKAASVGPQP